MNDSRNYLIVTDMDGTFLGTGAAVVPRNIDAIKRFRERGGMFTVSTGRHFRDLCSSVPGIDTLVNVPASCCNGSILVDLRDKRMIETRPMDKAVGMKIVDYIIKNYTDLGVRIAADQGFVSSSLFTERSDLIKKEYGERLQYCLTLIDTEKWADLTWYKMVVKGENARLEKLWSELRELFCGQMTFSSSTANTYEIQSPTVNKAVTLGSIKKYCAGISGREPIVIACGDFDNDVEMLKAADISVCPSNAQPSVKEICDYCLCSNDEGLIADVIEKVQ